MVENEQEIPKKKVNIYDVSSEELIELYKKNDEFISYLQTCIIKEEGEEDD